MSESSGGGTIALRRHLPIVAEERAPATRARSRDAGALERGLRDVVRGEVRFDEGSRALYAADASNYRQVPLGVVVPEDERDVLETFRVCREHGVPITPRGAGTSLAGQTTGRGIIVDCSKRLRRILAIDSERRIARVQPGVVLDDLRAAANEVGLTFGPDPATHRCCTLGGMLGNDSCGVHALMAGKTSENVVDLDVLLYDGTRMRVGATGDDQYRGILAMGGRRAEVYRALRALRDRHAGEIRARFADIPRRVSGYSLDALLPENGFHVARALVGSEATCVFVLEATLRLVPEPGARKLVVLGFEDVYAAAAAVPEVLESEPIGLEGIDDQLVGYMRRKGMHPDHLALLPEGRGHLLVELAAGDPREAEAKAGALCERMTRGGRRWPTHRAYSSEDAHRVWTIRESGLGATARVPGMRDTWPGWEDSAVPPARLADYLRDLRALFDRYGYEASLYGHFGQGCVHCRIPFDLVTAHGIDQYRRFVHDAAHLVASYGGSLSGEHGDGHARGALLPIQYGDRIVRAFHEFKAIWDPEGGMNPRQAAQAPPVTSDLRLGTDYAPPRVETVFRFPDDDGSFARATTRCVGVGKCRRDGGGTMCPSYMVTREEKHTTRGRAHLLFEMLQQDVVRGGWRDEEVKDSLDLCLACKGCKSDCPVNVDVATYKAEFLAHYYEGRVRPMPAYAMGLIDVWARLAEPLPGLASWLVGDSAMGRLARRIAGLAPERPAPAFAKQTFRAWWRARGRDGARRGGPRVLIWPDTFNDHFHPEIGIAAVEALEALGYDVDAIEPRLCCGRPLYDYGMLGRAQRLLARFVDTMRDEIRAGTPIVALEPSCGAVLRDELLQLFPDDRDALRLSEQTFSIAELLRERPSGRRVPRAPREIVLHGHCHEKSVLDFGATIDLLREGLGADVRVLDSGCCGLAGSFGYEREKYGVSMAAGERVLLPAVRAASESTLVVTDGFSCRSQIEHGAHRRALHVAEVLRDALVPRP